MMKHLFLLAALLFSMTANAQVQLENPEFTFALPSGWTQLASTDPEQWSFESEDRRSSVVLSIMTKMNIPKTRLVEAAQKFASIRKESEQRARPGQKLVYGDQWVELKPSGDVAEIAYAAHDQTGTIFRFFGFVTQAKVISFWVSTTGNDNGLSKRAFDEAFRGLKFYVP